VADVVGRLAKEGQSMSSRGQGHQGRMEGVYVAAGQSRGRPGEQRPYQRSMWSPGDVFCSGCGKPRFTRDRCWRCNPQLVPAQYQRVDAKAAIDIEEQNRLLRQQLAALTTNRETAAMAVEDKEEVVFAGKGVMEMCAKGWVLDTGCTRTMSPDVGAFVNLRKTAPVTIYFGGSSMKTIATQVGDLVTTG